MAIKFDAVVDWNCIRSILLEDDGCCGCCVVELLLLPLLVVLWGLDVGNGVGVAVGEFFNKSLLVVVVVVVCDA